MRICVYLKTFYASTTTNTLSQQSKQCKKRLFLITRTELTCWSSGVHFRIWRKFDSTNLPVPNSIHLPKPIKTFSKVWEVTVGGPSVVFRRKAVVVETFIRSSEKICISIVGIDASQLYLYSMCQPMPTGLYTWWEYDTESNSFKPQQNKSRNFENMVISFLQWQRPDCKIESFYTTGTQRKVDCFKVHGFCAHYNTVFEAMGCFYC